MAVTSKTKFLIRLFRVFFILPFASLILIFILIETGAFGFMPDFEDLENPKTNLASEIYSSDGVLLGKFFKENRTVIEYTDVSQNMINALVATEDIRFYDHSGIDARALGRVIKGILMGNRAGGGSTLTQQLAKNLFPRGEVKSKFEVVILKFKEWITAVKLERNYTKQEILAMYLNTVFYGSNSYGLKTAAKTFFNKSPSKLKIEEAAILVGVLKAPSYYNPRFKPENALRRRNTVLNQIKKYQKKLNDLHGFKLMTDAQYDSLKTLPIKLDYSVRGHSTGGSNYFREFLRISMTRKKPVAPEGISKRSARFRNYVRDSIRWIEDPLYGWCNKNTKPNGKPYNLYRDGIKIYTTINSKMQKYAEEALAEHMGKTLQPLFFKRQKNRDKAPFSWMMSEKEIDKIWYLSMRRSERYRLMKIVAKKEDKKLDSTEVRRVFDIPVPMNVFSWKGDIDTIMSPLDSIKYYKYFLRAGFVSMEPQTGYVKAYVGGINYNHFKYDHVTKAKRQVGSTIKPFLYSVAMEDKLSPCHKVPNIPVTFKMPEGQHPATYTPKFSKTKRDGQMVSLKYGLANSMNQISAWIIKKYHPVEIVKMAHKVGIKSDLDTVYSLCVGAAEVKLEEMVASYNTFANKGVHIEPLYVTNIIDKNNNEIARFAPTKKEVLNENTAYRMVTLMRGVVDMGTSVRLRYKYGFKNEIAGKTGTTNDNSDGWFIGFVPNLVSGAWVGGEERSVRFPSTADGQGANMALPIWAIYMKKIYADGTLGISKEKFEEPKHDDGIPTDCDDYDDSENSGNQQVIDEDEFNNG